MDKEVDKEVIAQIDAAICTLAGDIEKERLLPEYRVDTAKAIAVLIAARAMLQKELV